MDFWAILVFAGVVSRETGGIGPRFGIQVSQALFKPFLIIFKILLKVRIFLHLFLGVVDVVIVCCNEHEVLFSKRGERHLLFLLFVELPQLSIFLHPGNKGSLDVKFGLLVDLFVREV